MAYQSEIEKLEQRFREKPEQWFAALADVYRKNGDLDLALEILVTWIEKRPAYTSGYIVQGRCLLDKGDDVQAADAFRKVLDLDPENIIALRSLGDIAQRSDDASGAREWITRLLEVDPMNEQAHELLEALGGPAEPPVEASSLPTPSSGLGAAPEEPTEAMTVDESPMGLDPTPQLEGEAEWSDPSPGFDTIGAEEEPEHDGEVVPTDGLVGAAEAPVEPVVDAPAISEPPAPIGFEATAAEAGAFGTDEAGPMEPGLDDVSTEQATHDEEADEAPGAIGEEQTYGVEAVSSDAVEGEPPDTQVAKPISLASEPLADESIEQRLEVESFDEDLGWDEGERQSKQVTDEDVSEAAAMHADGLEDAAVQELPGMEAEEIPSSSDVQVHDDAATEGVVPVGETAGEGDLADVAAEPVFEDAEAEFVPESTSREGELVASSSVSESEPVEATNVEDRSLDLIMPDDVTPAAEEPPPVVTATMADLHAEQGLYDQARAIYGQLLEQDPGNADLAAKLSGLEGKVNEPKQGETPSAPTRRFSIAITGGESARDMLLTIAGVAPEDRPSRPPTTPNPGSGAAAESSFDQFFGNPPEETAEATTDTRTAEPSEPGQGDEKAFQSWLKDLKT